MYTQNFSKDHIYNFSENVSDFLQEFLNDSQETNKEEWSYFSKEENHRAFSLPEQLGTSAFPVKSLSKTKAL